MKQWIKGECEAIPGKTMPAFKVVKRDYKNVYNQFTSYGPLVRQNGLGAHGTSYQITDEYDEYIQTHRTETWDGNTYPSLDRDEDVCNAILHFATVTNGELGLPFVPGHGRKDGRAACAFGGKKSRLPYVVQRHSEPAATVYQQPDVVGPDRERSLVFTVHLQRRSRRSMANADRSTVVLSGPSGLPRLWRALADVQAKAVADRVLGLAVHRGGKRRRSC